MTSQPSSILLDKGVIRRIYEFQVRVAKGLSPTPSQIEAVKVLVRLQHARNQLHITQQSANILQRRQPQYAKAILSGTGALQKGRYLRRWARRLREYAFSREDAVILAYGSFGVDLKAQSIGVGVIVTADLKLVTNFNARSAEVKERFDQMTLNLPTPYRSLSLPEVVTSATVLTDW